MSTGKLLFSRRFAPMFWVQFLGAFNDNLLKQVVVLLVTYEGLKSAQLSPQALVSLASGLFILPFFLFSGQAGQVTDRFSKMQLVRLIKAFEVVILILATTGFFLSSIALLMTVLFLMGAHSAFFGPVKYSILKELVDEHELNAANALIEMGTFLAILVGTLTAGVLVSQKVSPVLSGFVGVALAGGGLLASFSLPTLKPGSPDLKVQANPFPSILETLRVSKKTPSVFHSIMGISWFWLVGATLLALLPLLAKEELNLPEAGVTYFLALFCVGIAVGAVSSEKLGGHKMELGLVPMGSFFLSVGLFDWGLALSGLTPSEASVSLSQFIRSPLGLRLSLDLLVVAFAGGLFTVPLYTLLQERTDAQERGRVIAGNNILNALFMVASAVMVWGFGARGVPTWATLMVLAVMNFVVAIYIYTLVPEFLFRFTAWCLAHMMYRLRVRGAEHIPGEGPAILAPNHVSFVDWLLLSTVTQRPIRFVMYYKFHQIPLLGFLFRDAKVIPIASRSEDPAILDAAMEHMERALKEGELLCIFPEGALTDSGNLLPFKPGVLKVLAKVPVPVIPVGIVGMWGSFFSRKDKQAFLKPFRRVWSRVQLTVGAPIKPEGLTLENLEKEVGALSQAA